MKLKLLIGATIIATAAAGGAQAATATFDVFKGPMVGVKSSFASNTGSQTLAVSGTRFNKSGVSARMNSKVRQKKAGFGLKKGKRDSWKIDGRGRDDVAVLKFDKSLSVDSITFGNVGRRSNAKFDIMVSSDGGTTWNKIGSNLNRDGKGRVQTYTFQQPVQGSVFAIRAKGNKAAFSIRSVATSFQDITPVPLPAGGLLLLTGLAGFGVARRKKRS